MQKSVLAVLLSMCFLAMPAAVQSQDRTDCPMHAMADEHAMTGCGAAGMDGCGMQGSGMCGMHASGNQPFSWLGPIRMLDLTPEQRTKLDKIGYDLRKQHWALEGRLIDEDAKLSSLYAADRPDPKKIGAVYGAVFDIRRQMIEARIEAMNRAKDVLTKEQNDRLKRLQQGRMGMMHHDMMGGMMQDRSTGTE